MKRNVYKGVIKKNGVIVLLRLILSYDAYHY